MVTRSNVIKTFFLIALSCRSSLHAAGKIDLGLNVTVHGGLDPMAVHISADQNIKETLVEAGASITCIVAGGKMMTDGLRIHLLESRHPTVRRRRPDLENGLAGAALDKTSSDSSSNSSGSPKKYTRAYLHLEENEDEEEPAKCCKCTQGLKLCGIGCISFAAGLLSPLKWVIKN